MNQPSTDAAESLTSLFGDAISKYTRAQAIEDGVLHDLTEWASTKSFLGGFIVPVAVTAAVWNLIQDIPERFQGIQDVRGRAHDVLWMASLATRRAVGGDPLFYTVNMITSGRSGRALKRFKIVVGPGDNRECVITIMLPNED